MSRRSRVLHHWTTAPGVAPTAHRDTARLAVGSAVLAVRRAEAELFAMFSDTDVIEAVRRRS
ncbi:hypothetical protein [Streptomyces chartreusis]